MQFQASGQGATVKSYMMSLKKKIVFSLEYYAGVAGLLITIAVIIMLAGILLKRTLGAKELAEAIDLGLFGLSFVPWLIHVLQRTAEPPAKVPTSFFTDHTI